MKEHYIGTPVEQLHGNIMELFHEYRKGVGKFAKEVYELDDAVIAIDGRILNKIIVEAKKRIKEESK